MAPGELKGLVSVRPFLTMVTQQAFCNAFILQKACFCCLTSEVVGEL